MHSKTTAIRVRQIGKRDGYGRCFYCGVRFEDAGKRQRTVDHVIPECNGGTHHLRNLVCCCLRCNLAKGVQAMDEFEASRYLHMRRVAVLFEELDRLSNHQRYSHSSIRFLTDGSWLCAECGNFGEKAQSPTMIECGVAS